MSAVTLRQTIAQSLAALEQGPLAAGARALLTTLGYQSERWLELEPTAEAFLAAFDHSQRLNQANARIAEWRSVEMVTQLTGDDLVATNQLRLSLDWSPAFAAQTYQSFLFFAVDLAGKPEGRPYTRSELAAITREINKPFLMPVSVLFRHSGALTLAIVTHRPNRRDESRDVLEKVSLIRDVRCQDPHRAHLEILADLSLPALAARQTIAGFSDLQRAWARTLDITELNRRFYREIANWYFWAVEQVRLPELPATPREQRNAVAMIRLITRLIFVWFLKEKGLVPDALFDRAQLASLLVDLDSQESSYYRAILQNLFFATLNQETGRRAFRDERSFQGRNAQHGVANLYRYHDLFRQPDKALALFAQVPFLNGGLFECLDDAERKLYVDGFSDNPRNQPLVPNELFFAGHIEVDLNRTYGTRGRHYQVRGILEILESYKFTVAENTPVEEDVALDPELLGQVFENLLAAYNPETETTARKETGSFYTPRGVVNYMVDESLLIYLKDHLQKAAPLIPPSPPILTPHPPLRNGEGEPRSGGGEVAEGLDARLRELLAYNNRDVSELFSRDEIGHLIAAIDALTVIDPACGSGAFPMGMLQKLVHVLARLDADNQRWREIQRRRALRETSQAYQIDDKDVREQRLIDISEAFEFNSSDYGRKLFLIEHCIYGVDIQPIAVQIAKLRCFISLVVDQQIHDDRENRGIRPLPNLETKFVAADALLSVERPQQLMLRTGEVEQLERELAEVRESYFRARTAADKRACRAQDKRLRDQLAAQLEHDGWHSATAKQLAAWDPYAQNERADFFDPEWMFGRTDGFGIVIANPPYVRQELIKELKPKLAGYATYSGTADLYVYFYERAVELLAPGGVLTFISSNKFFRAGYGQKLRRYLADTTTIHQIIDFGDAPIFTAIAYPSIIIAQKSSPNLTPPTPLSAAERGEPRSGGGEVGHQLLALNWNPTDRLEEFPRIVADARAAHAAGAPSAPYIKQQSLGADVWRLEGGATQRLLEKLRRAGRPLGDYVGGRFYYGIKTGLNEAFVVDRATRDRLVAEHPSSAAVLKPFLRGRDVKRWRVQFAEQYLIKFESSENNQHPWSGKPDLEAERVFAKRYPAIHHWFEPLRADLIKRYDQGKYFWELRACAYWPEFEQPKILYPDIAKQAEFAYVSEPFYAGNTLYIMPTDQKWLLGLLNSTPVFWFYSQLSTKIRGDFVRWIAQYVSQLPIPVGGDTRAIAGLVERVLALTPRLPLPRDLTPPAPLSAAERGEPRSGGGEFAALEREIDERVYALYGLRPDEIRLIEEQVRGGAG
ncbi:MAG: hypothetical protein Fur005_21780 [Roseiflexaceae bacterium]